MTVFPTAFFKSKTIKINAMKMVVPASNFINFLNIYRSGRVQVSRFTPEDLSNCNWLRDSMN